MNYAKIASVATNIVYPIAGIFTLLQGGPLAPFLFTALVALGLGSSWFHYVEDFRRVYRYPGRIADRWGMYLVFSTLTLLALGIHSWIVLAFLWIALTVFVRQLDTRLVLGILGSIILVSLIGNWKGFATTIGLFVVAWRARLMDEPSATGYLHSLWHIMSGYMIYLLFQYFT